MLKLELKVDFSTPIENCEEGADLWVAVEISDSYLLFFTQSLATDGSIILEFIPQPSKMISLANPTQRTFTLMDSQIPEVKEVEGTYTFYAALTQPGKNVLEDFPNALCINPAKPHEKLLMSREMVIVGY